MSRFVICINNDRNPASLILGKVYRSLPDAAAEAQDMLRVIDEDKSERDGYLYPASMFAPIELPEAAERALMAAGDWGRCAPGPTAWATAASRPRATGRRTWPAAPAAPSRFWCANSATPCAADRRPDHLPEGRRVATITIRGIPDPLYRRLKKRAAEHRRSLNSEILICLDRYVQGIPVNPGQFLRRVDALRKRLALPPVTEKSLRAAKYTGRS